jgi:4-hydroxy-tetrahydrodipicolinate synthase
VEASMFSGSIVALITPFRAQDGKVDEPALKSLVEWHIEQGTNGIVPCGTTGESPTLSHAEHMRVIEVVVDAAGKRLPIIAGTGSNSTVEAIELTRHAKQVGADAALIVTPYYNKPTQEGLYLHYKAIHDAVDLPIVIYNIPGRCVVDMSVATMARLAKLKNIIGVKDATNDLARPVQTRASCGPKFAILSGEDGTAAALLAQGGDGCISVTANVAPKQCADLQKAWQRGDIKTFGQLRDRLMPLHDSLFVETNPGPVKYGVSLLGRAHRATRLPLAPIGEATMDRVAGAMRSVGLVN